MSASPPAHASASASAGTDPALARARRRGLAAVAALVLLGGALWAGWHWAEGRHREVTDNAYVAGHVVQLTPQVSGTVVAVLADDTDMVRAGQPLVRLDAADAGLALAQAEAELAQAVRDARTLFAARPGLAAQVAQREAELARIQADAARAQEDVERRRPLVASGAVGLEELRHAQAQWDAARGSVAAAAAALQAAREQLAVHQAQTEGLVVERHPQVLRAAARLREAWLAHQRTTLVAPVSGQVVRRSVQLGQRVAAGTPLLSVVALDRLWVDANFKEGQLRELRIGQPVALKADVYGSQVVYQGRVAGLGAGTGAAFALLPAQNATGNWIKVVQRVPVRIALDARQLASHPLRVGLSMVATVDTSDPSGPLVSQAPPAPAAEAGAAAAASAASAAASSPADALVARIIAAGSGRSPAPDGRR